MGLLWLVVGCGGSSPWWMDELVAESPCYRVDLLDGLDSADTAEWHDLFACLDQGGRLSPLRPLDDALDVQTRGGETVGAELAGVVSHLAGADVDPFALAGVALGAVSRAEADPWLDLSLELVYGVPADDVRAGLVEVGDPDRVAAGVLAPLGDVLPVTAGVLLDDDLDAASLAGELLEDPRTDRWIRTFGSVMSSDDPAIAEPLRPIVTDFAAAVLAARSPANDRWSGASGDSLRDVVDFFAVRDHPVVDDISPAVDAMLGDPLVRGAIVPTIDTLQQQGHVAPLGEQLAWLSSVDLHGEPLAAGEPSAFYRFTRLLAANNAPVDCSIDLVITSIDWQFDNFAVTTLEVVADMRPGQVEDLAGIVSDLTGGGVTLDLLELAVDSGVCPSLTSQTLEDLSALSVVTQPEATDLLATFVAALGVLQDGEQDHLPEFADLATALFEAGALEPAEELIRDWGGAPLSADVAALVPVLVHPEQHGITAGDAAPTTLEDAVDAAQWVFAVDPDNGLTGSQRLRPWIASTLGADGTWRAIGAFAAVAADPRSTSSELPSLVPSLLALDPDLVLVHEVGPLVRDRQLAGPLLRVVERREVTGALLASSPVQYGEADGVGEVPLGWWGRLVVDGVLEAVLSVTNALLGALGSPTGASTASVGR